MPDKPECLYQQKIQKDQIEVWQQQDRRWLTINSILQTCIDIRHPQTLTSPVYPAFLTVLLFIKKPGKILLAGTGGGAIARYLFHQAPDIKGDAIEINTTIADLASQYFDFPDKQWDLIVDDIRLWSGADYDLVFLDIAESEFTPTWLTGKNMLTRMKQQLSPEAVLVFNLLVPDAQTLSSHLKSIRDMFGRRTLCLSVAQHNNIVVFAFNQPPDFHTTREIESRLAVAQESWGIDFRPQIERLNRDNPVGSGIF